MARIAQTGWEIGLGTSVATRSIAGPDGGDTTGSIAVLDTTVKRTGATALKMPASGTSANTLVFTGSGTTEYWRFYFRKSGNPSSDTLLMHSASGGGLIIRTDGSLQIWDTTGAAVGSPSSALANDTWHLIECGFTAPGAVFLEVKINGTSVLNSQTKASSPGTLQYCRFYNCAAADFWFDDFAANDTTGSVNNSWIGPGSVVLLKPVSDNTRHAAWTGGAGGTTNLYDAVDNTPPLGTATETNLTQIESASATVGSNDRYIANLTSYTAAGLTANDTLRAVQAWVCHGEDINTGTKSGFISVDSNPTLAEVAFNFGDDVGALGTHPTNWRWQSTAFAQIPSVTLANQPPLMLRRNDTTSRVGSASFVGMYVEYSPNIVIGQGTDPGASTLAPGGSATEVARFSLQTPAGSGAVSSITVSLGTNVHGGISLVEITSADGATVYGSQADPSSSTVTITLSGLTATTTLTEYRIRVTPKSHANMPAVPGQAYTLNANVVSLYSIDYGYVDNDTAGGAVVIDNLSPGISGPAQLVDSTGGPSNRSGGVAVWDPVNSRLLVHGGSTTDAAARELWSWTDGGGWTALTTAGTDQLTIQGQAVWDTQAGRMLVFGGLDAASAYYNRLYAYKEGVGWSTVTANGAGGSPVARQLHAAAWDPTGNRLFIFGGYDGSAHRNDLWQWTSAGGWSQLTANGAGGSPAIRSPRGQLFWNDAEQALYLFGGGAGTTRYNDLWKWTQAGGWTQVIADDAVGNPPSRTDAALAFDESTGTLFVWGGIQDSPVNLSSDAWKYTTAGGWIQLYANDGTSLGGKYYRRAAACWDSTNGRLVFFGGDSYTDSLGTSATTHSEVWAYWNAAAVVSVTATPGDNKVTVAYTTSNISDVSEVLILYRTGSAVTDAPVEGTTYSTGNTIGSSTVFKRASVAASTAYSDDITSLTGGTPYYFKVFVKDSRGNYSLGVTPSGSPATPTAGGSANASGVTLTVTASFTAGSATGDATAAGQTLTGTATFIPGSASGQADATANGTTITATATLTAGTATGGGTATGQTITATGTFTGGGTTADASAGGQTLTATATFIAGTASGVQKKRPNQTNNASVWIGTPDNTNLHNNLDEDTPSDTDFCYSSPDGDACTLNVSLQAGSAPTQALAPHYLRVRLAKLNDAVLDNTGNAISVDVSLKNGSNASVIATRNFAPDGFWQEYLIALTNAEIGNIISYSAIQVEIFVAANGGAVGSRRGAGVSWVEFSYGESGTAEGVVFLAPVEIVAGTVEAAATAAGQTITGTATFTGGAATGDAAAAGVTLTATTTFTGGAANADASANGQTLTATISQIDGTATGEAFANGQTLTGTASFTGGGQAADATAAGQTLTATATFIPGEASQSSNGDATGVTLTATGTFTGGAASGDAVAAGVTLTVSSSVIAGTATGDASAAGQTITATATFTGGGTSATASAAGQTITGTASFTGGAASGDASAAGQTIVATATFIPGSATGSDNATADGVTLTAAASFTVGTATGDATANGQTLAVSTNFTAGAQTADASVGGQTLTGTATFIPGTAEAGSAGTANGVTLTGTATFTAGTATGDAAAAGQTLTATATFSAGNAQGSSDANAAGETYVVTANFIAGGQTADANQNGSTQTGTVSFTGGAAAGDATAAGQTLTSTATFVPGTAVAEDNADVNGVTLTATATFIPGEASGASTGTANGVTLPVSVGIVPGAASGDAVASGQTFTVTASLIAGAAEGPATATGQTITATATFIPGAQTATANAGGTTQTGTVTFTPGAATGTAEAAGQTYAVTATFVPGAASGASTGTANGTTLTSSVGVIPGSATGDALAAGQTITGTATFIAGAASGGASAAGQTLEVAASFIPGAQTATASAGGATVQGTATFTGGAATGGGTAAGQTFTGTATFIAGAAIGENVASGATIIVVSSFIPGAADAVRNPTVGGQTFTRTVTFLAGSAAGTAAGQAAGVLLEATASLLADGAGGGAGGVTLVGQIDAFVSGAATGGAVATGVEWAVEVSFITGVAQGPLSPGGTSGFSAIASSSRNVRRAIGGAVRNAVRGAIRIATRGK